VSGDDAHVDDLFATAGALVTDGGGLLSHTVIIAREHGLPIVVATGTAYATETSSKSTEMPERYAGQQTSTAPASSPRSRRSDRLQRTPAGTEDRLDYDPGAGRQPGLVTSRNQS
jgi:hypothetical protein